MWKRIFFLLGFLINSMMMYSQPPNNWKLVTIHHPVPVANAGPNLYLGSGQTSVQPMVTDNDPGPGQTYTYSWTGPSFASNLKTPQFTAPGTYMCIVANPYGCTTTAQVTVLVSPWAPLPPMCIGDTLDLDAYIPYPGDGSFTGTGIVGRRFPGTTSGNFTLTWTSTDGSITGQATAVVYPNPDVYIYGGASLTNCIGSNLSLRAVGFANTYSWSYLSTPGFALSTLQDYSVKVDSTVSYLLTASLVQPGKTCSIKDTVVVRPITAEFRVLQDTTYTQNNVMVLPSSVKLEPFYTEGYSYSWTFGDGGTSTEVNPDHNYYPRTGEFKATLTLKTFCPSAMTSFVWIKVNHAVITGIDDVVSEEMTIYPNPATDYIKIKINETDEVSSVQILDLSGRIVSQEAVTGTTVTVGIQNLTPGMYLVKLVSETNRISPKKFMKQ